MLPANGGWRVLRRHRLNTRAKRLALVAGYAAPPELEHTRETVGEARVEHHQALTDPYRQPPRSRPTHQFYDK